MRLEVPVQSWEYQLLNWAHEPLRSATPVESVYADSPMLEAAYRYCDDVTRFHSRTFYMASSLLPAHKRQAVRALYAFCRVTDNLVDETPTGADAQVSLQNWQRCVALPQPPPYEPVALAWADTQARFQIPAGYATQLIQGVARDLTQKRYRTFADLAEYSYGVASTVGLMAMHIVGFQGDEAVPYAVKLGVALQMTNILRDIYDDWQAGRLYLPQDELSEFHLTEADIDSQRNDERWQRFMQFQIDRNRRLYAESTIGIGMLNRDGRFAIAAAAHLYRAILDEIEQRRGNVFQGRVSVSTWGKIRRLPNIWWQAYRSQYRVRTEQI